MWCLLCFVRKAVGILNKWHLSSDANKFEVRRKPVSIKIDKLIFGLKDEVTIPGKETV